MNNDQIKVIFAEEEHAKYAEQIVTLIYESALQRGTGIARRTPEYIAKKIRGGKAVVALCDDRLIGHIRPNRRPRIPTIGACRQNQSQNIRTCQTQIPVRKIIQYHHLATCHEAKFTDGI